MTIAKNQLPALDQNDVGLGNVDNTSDANKPVSTAQQIEIDTKEDSFAKNTAFNKNFGSAATTVCEGDDARLSDARTPTAHTHTLSDVTDSGTAAALDVPATGDAAAGEVVKGDDTRLTDARTPTSHTHIASEITDFDTEVSNNLSVAANTAKVTNATHTGDVTGATALTIADEAVTNAKLAHIATSTIKGRVTAATGVVEDLTATQARFILNVEDGATNGDSDAIHDNVASEISAITAKAVPVGGDFMLIEDSAAGNVKKSILISNLPFAEFVTGDAPFNVDILSADPTSPTNGDLWVIDTGGNNYELRVHDGGVTYSVAGGGGGGGHTIQEEGSDLTQRTNLNFIGAAVTATDNAGNDATDVTITAPELISGDAFANVDVLSADPTTPANGDIWIKDTGVVRTFNARIVGVTYSVALT